ncbi:MAG: DNA-processing protein DprA [Solirubrobacteraceae bacterium]
MSAHSVHRACANCLRRSWLLARLTGCLDTERRRISELLDLDDEDLLEAVGGQDTRPVRSEWHSFDVDRYRERCEAAELETLCRCDPAYPGKLWALAAEPAVLHVAGGMERFLRFIAEDAVAIVGARRASPYAIQNARSLAGGVARSRTVTVVSGMAAGVDSAAHEGALHVGGATVAVLGSSPERPYPASARRLHREIVSAGVAVSELGPGVATRRWMFPARNRIIAALSDLTVVVAARQGSGALLTAQEALRLGRRVGAVPGQVTAPLSFGPHALLKTGADLIGGPVDVFVALFGEDRRLPPELTRPRDPELIALFDAIADGYELASAFAEAGLEAEEGLAALAALEMGGYVSRQAGGRYSIVP